jgi:LmbE family N-acetylglucosaminyl deacetylase
MLLQPAVGLNNSPAFLRAIALAVIFVMAAPIGAQNPAIASGDPGSTDRFWGQLPLPQDEGFTGFYQEVNKLRSTARLMATAAHPDDEDGPMLAMESRGLGATALELTINRGEGGQNRIGSELFDELGILRTLELLQADQYYGVEERFTRAVDFGFSKSAEETFEKWGGHEPTLSDMVRVIRTFRPDVIMSVFTGTPSDGHGHHQASGILTREAFRAAGDPNRFPEQIKDGLLPWRPKKLYMRSFRGGDDWSVRLDVGTYSPALGMSYIQTGVIGRAHQVSQVIGSSVPPGHSYSYYKLVDSALPEGVKAGVREKDFFDGIDTSLPGLSARLGAEANKLPALATALDKLDAVAKLAAAVSPQDMTQAATPLLSGVNVLRELIPQVESSSLSAAAKAELLTHLRTKLEQFEKAAADAGAVTMLASVDTPGNSSQPSFFRQEQTFLIAVPGQTFTMTAHLYNRGQQKLDQVHMNLELPLGWKAEQINFAPGHGAIESNAEASAQFRVTVPENAQYTRPWFYHSDPQTESFYKVVPELAQYVTLPFPPPPVIAHAEYITSDDLTGEASAVTQVKFIDPIYGQSQRPLAVGPALSVELEPVTQVISTTAGLKTEVRVGVRNNVLGPIQGTLKLSVPQGWRAEPASLPAKFFENGEYESFSFTVTPGPLREQKYEVKAVLDAGGKQFDQGYRVETRHDIGTFYYYHPAQQQVSAVAVKLPKTLRVGYIMGAGDDIPPVLKQIGIDLQMISPAELASGDLSRYDTIVLGIRAYDVRTDVRDQNRRLLDYVSRGGTLVVQYNQQTGQFNAGHYTPYPASASGERVTVEEAPVEVLAPNDRVFNFPNKIGPKDFDGWVQERGVYFMSQWDEHYTPLLSSHDPGEAPLKGGLLVAKYGQGTYIFTGYAFFRQLPAGVPGAIRLFANLLSVGAKGQ